MIRILIVDDEKRARHTLTSIIERHCRNAVVVGEAESVKTGIAAILELKPQLVLLDIKLHDGTGFDILSQLPSIDFALIFITAFEQYAVKAFRFSALDYLLKPVDPEELVHSINKAEETLNQKNINTELKVFRENYFNKNKESKKIVIKTSDVIYVVSLKDIIRCEADGNYTWFFLNTGQKYFVSKGLKEYDDLFEGYGFLRVHQSHLVNLDFFESYVKSNGGYIKMKDKSTVPVSSRKKEDLMRLIENL